MSYRIEKARKQYFPFTDWSETETAKTVGSVMIPGKAKPNMGFIPAITRISIKKPITATVKVDMDQANVPIETSSDMTTVIRFLGLSTSANEFVLATFACETCWHGGALSLVGKWLKTPQSVQLLTDGDRRLIKKMLMDLHKNSQKQ